VKSTWAEEKVIQSAGIRLEDADDRIRYLARVAVEKCYYIESATQWLLGMLQGPP